MPWATVPDIPAPTAPRRASSPSSGLQHRISPPMFAVRSIASRHRAQRGVARLVVAALFSKWRITIDFSALWVAKHDDLLGGYVVRPAAVPQDPLHLCH